jgi:hypothetical protein
MPEEFRDGNYGYGPPTSPADRDVTDTQLTDLTDVPDTSYGGPEGFYQSVGAPDSGSSSSIPQDDIRYRQEHEPYNYQPDGDQFVYITKAHLYEIHPLTSELIKRHELTPLKIKLDTAKGCVYTQFMTDINGKILGDYILLKTEEDEPPESTPFELNDGDGTDSGGAEGFYNVLLFKFENGQILRNLYDSDKEPDPRSVKLYGGVAGHRGPLIWSCGYNSLHNVGLGQGLIYRDYTLATDRKNLRTLKEADHSGQSSPFSTDARINIATSGDHITIRGNSYDTNWVASENSGIGYSQTTIGVVQDGVVNSLTNLSVASCLTNFTTTNIPCTVQELSTTDVVTSSGTKTYTVRQLATETLEQQLNAWHGGSSLELAYHNVTNTTGSDVWVLGVVGSQPSTPPSNVTFINGANTYTGVKSLSASSVTFYQAHASATKFLEADAEDNMNATNGVLTSGSTAKVFTTSSADQRKFTVTTTSDSHGTSINLLKSSSTSGSDVVSVLRAP